jgi:hypothetical protein
MFDDDRGLKWAQERRQMKRRATASASGYPRQAPPAVAGSGHYGQQRDLFMAHHLPDS